ncbi:hypothetical protein CYMTET_30348 [Cymbomonas tetramitiformis]|uniref:Uncharacterized protein n=1 Tax=Cymbomonas tetramitiformis TaxID=36881 RepID=A0AAE0FJ19_9CHLO|nr:hypothetical protein CYMTET_30348 [Cymbomonas tetramitiformis]
MPTGKAALSLGKSGALVLDSSMGRNTAKRLRAPLEIINDTDLTLHVNVQPRPVQYPQSAEEALQSESLSSAQAKLSPGGRWAVPVACLVTADQLQLVFNSTRKEATTSGEVVSLQPTLRGLEDTYMSALHFDAMKVANPCLNT